MPAPKKPEPKTPAPTVKEYFNKLQCEVASKSGSILKAVGAVGGIGAAHMALDMAGLLPGVGEAFDGINAILYLTQGDKVNAGLSAMSMIPVIGSVGTAAKVAKTVSKPAGGIAAGIVYKAPKSLKKLTAKGSGKLPKPGSLSNIETRRWYLGQEAKIKSMLDTSKPLEKQARQAFELRNHFRTQARELMSDRITAESLCKTDPNMTWAEIIKKYTNEGLSDNALWEKIIDASTRSRASVNKGLGLE